MPFLFILSAFVIQFFWLMSVKRGQIAYVRDLIKFRPPQHLLSKYTSWRVSSVRSAAIDAIVVNAISNSLVIVYVLLAISPEEYPWVIGLAILISSFSVLSVVQMVRQVAKIHAIESDIIEKIEGTIDKIGEARKIVEYNLKTSERNAYFWFALFRVAQVQNQIGWSIRDVLIEYQGEILNKTQK